MDKISTKLTLKQLFIGVLTLAFILAISSSLYSSYRWNMQMLKEHSLDKNQVYAEKLSQIVTLYFTDKIQTIEHTTKKLSGHLDDEIVMKDVVDHLLYQDYTFNSVIIANKDGLILEGGSKKESIKGRKIASKEGLELIRNQVKNISDPYLAATGKYLITLSCPIFSPDGEYEGLINGAIYLQESNFFDKFLGKHKYQDGSYVYVVDSKGTIIYHKDPERVGDDVSENEVVQKLMNGESSAQAVTNTVSEKMLAGYSPVALTKWGIVAQTPEKVAVESVGSQVKNMFLIQLPLIILSIIIVFIFAEKITKPLQQLAILANSSTQESEMKKLHQLKVVHYEALQIKNALIKSFSFFHKQVKFLKDQTNIDPLTQLTNRRGMQTVLHSWTLQERPYSVILSDIDFFKKVNDTYGHTVGDEVLKFFANQMKQVVGDKGICCRYGGEEFIMLLPEVTDQEAYEITEKLAQTIKKTVVKPCKKPFTFSSGIVSFPKHSNNPEDIIRIADKALYEAKQTGRNKNIIASGV